MSLGFEPKVDDQRSRSIGFGAVDRVKSSNYAEFFASSLGNPSVSFHSKLTALRHHDG
jgi:hypothetical protein